MDTKQVAAGEWEEVDFDEVFWFRFKMEGRQEPGVFDIGTEGRSYSSSFEMTVSQDRPVKLELAPLGTIVTIQRPLSRRHGGGGLTKEELT